jgi:tetratricopeptide (TPR) repeat protein
MKSRFFRIQAVLFLFAVLLRLVYLFESSDNPTFFTPTLDGKTYHELARSLWQGQDVRNGFFWQPVFYPLFLALVYLFTHASLLAAKIIQAIIGGLTCVLTFRLGARMAGERTGLLAGVIMALYGPAIFFEGELLATGWALFFGAAVPLLFLRAQAAPDLKNLAFFGLCGALAVIARPTFLPFIVVAALWLLIKLRDQDSAKPALAGLAALGLGFFIIAGPVIIFKANVTGQAGLLPTSGGINFFIGNYPERSRTVAIRPGLDWFKFTERPVREGLCDHTNQSEFFYDQAKGHAKERPLRFTGNLFIKTAQFVSSREMPRNLDIYVFRQWSGVLSVLVWKIGPWGFPFGLIFPLALLGLIFQFARIPKGPILFIALYAGSIIIIFVASRYRLPILPLMSVLAAQGVFSLATVFREHNVRKRLIAAGVIAGGVVLSTAPGPFCEEKLNFEAELYNALGMSYVESEQWDRAQDFYNRALALDPDYTEAHFNVGCLHYRKKEQEQAIQAWDRALGLNPGRKDAMKNRYIALKELGLADSANAYLESIIPQFNRDAGLLTDFGRLLIARGKYNEAKGVFERAVGLNLPPVEAYAFLGDLYRMAGAFEKGISVYRQAISLDPGNGRIYFSLAILYADHQKAAEACRVLDRLKSIDPAWYEKAKQVVPCKD